MNRLVIFDLDGTLLDTLGDLCDAVNYALTRAGRPSRTLAEIMSFIGNGTKKLIERALGEGADEELVAQCIGCFSAYYKEHYNDKTYAYDGIKDLVEALKENGVHVGVVTNKLHDISVSLCCEHFGDVFDGVVGDIAGLERKPHPSKVLKMMADVGCDVCVMVGDSDVDVQTAKNAGILCIAVTWGFNSRERLVASNPEYIVDNAAQLEEELNEILNVKYC